jgi:hypothetical protein
MLILVENSVTYHMHSNYSPCSKYFLQHVQNVWVETAGKGGYVFFCLQYNILSAVKIDIQISEFKNISMAWFVI